jgi:hypothetical protein
MAYIHSDAFHATITAAVKTHVPWDQQAVLNFVTKICISAVGASWAHLHAHPAIHQVAVAETTRMIL